MHLHPWRRRLSQDVLREPFDILESQTSRSRPFRGIRGARKPVPETQGDSEVTVDRPGFGMFDELRRQREQPDGVDHVGTLPVCADSTLQPSAFQSGNPSVSRSARRPLRRSKATASSDRKQYGPRQYAMISLPFGKLRHRVRSSARGMFRAPGMYSLGAPSPNLIAGFPVRRIRRPHAARTNLPPRSDQLASEVRLNQAGAIDLRSRR